LLKQEQQKLKDKETSFLRMGEEKEALEMEVKTKLGELSGQVDEKQQQLTEKDASLHQLQDEKKEMEILTQATKDELKALEQESSSEKSEADKREQELSELKNQNEQLTLKTVQLSGEVEKLSKSLEDLENKRDQMSESLTSSSSEKERMQEEKERLATSADEAERQLTASTEDLAAVSGEKEEALADLAISNEKLQEAEASLELTQKGHNDLTQQLMDFQGKEKELGEGEDFFSGIEHIQGILKALVERKEEIAKDRELNEESIETQVQELAQVGDEVSTLKEERGIERKRHELYQTYLNDMGAICQKATSQLLEHLDPLPEGRRLFGIAIHELSETIKEIDKVKRKFALDLKRRLDEKKLSTLEQQLNTARQEVEHEKAQSTEYEKQIDELSRNLGLAQTEIRRRLASMEEWKQERSSELIKQLTGEIRGTLEKELRDDIEKQIRTSLENKIREELKTEMKQDSSRASIESKGRPVKRAVKAPRSNGPLPFVTCPTCKAHIEIDSDERPLTIRCSGCENEYVIREKQVNAPAGDVDPTSRSTPDQGRGITIGNGSVLNDDLVSTLGGKPRKSSGLPTGMAGVPASGKNINHGPREITCPHCSKVHNIPGDFLGRFTCSCGRRIRTS